MHRGKPRLREIHKLGQGRASLFALPDKWPGNFLSRASAKRLLDQDAPVGQGLGLASSPRGLGRAAGGQRCPNSIQLNFHPPLQGLGAQGQNTGELGELDKDKELIKTESKTRPPALPSWAAGTRGGGAL